jgi:general secretion pathway protein M
MMALGLALAMLGGVYLLFVAPLIEFYADRAALMKTRELLLVKQHAAAADLPALRTRIAEIRAAGDSSKGTLDGATDAIASASLQGRVEELASAAGVTIGSTESLPAEVRGVYRRLGVRMVLSGSYESLITLLARAEAAVPPLVLDNVQIRAFQKRPGTAPVTSLDASMEIYGFRADNKSAEESTTVVVKR